MMPGSGDDALLCQTRLFNQRRAGFTLIELSIVLIVVGLIISGVLVGRVLIHSAELRAVVAEKAEFTTAVNSFVLKYNCLPGDCAQAAALNLGTNGNGDHHIIQRFVQEPFYFWTHLSNANLIGWNPPATQTDERCPNFSPCLPLQTSSADGSPAGWWIVNDMDSGASGSWNIAANGGSYSIIYPTSNKHYFWITGGQNYGTLRSSVLTPQDAYDIDIKVDDGLPTSGGTLAGGDDPQGQGGVYLPLIGPGGANSDFCLNGDTTPYSYNTINTSRNADSMCSLLLQNNF